MDVTAIGLYAVINLAFHRAARMTKRVSNVPPGSAPATFLGKFVVLKGAMPELWIVFLIKFLVMAAYALTNTTIVLWLHSDLGFGDAQALRLVAAWSLVMTGVTLLVGSLTDVLGMRRTLFLGTWICIGARLVMVMTANRWLALGVGLLPLAVGEALSGPVLVAAVRRYSNTQQRSMSFSLIYVTMNFGFLAAGWMFDHFRHGFGEHGQFNIAGLHLSTYRIMFLASFIMEIMLLPLCYWIREGAEATDEGLKLHAQKLRPTDWNLFQSVGQTARQATRETGHMFVTLVRQAGFYRLLSFLVLIAFVKLIYRQMDYVYPTFGIRELGPGAPVGILWALNNLWIVILAPTIGALTQRYSAYSMVIVGAITATLSVFIMAMPPAWFVSIANGPFGNLVGHWYLGLKGNIHPYYVMIAIFVTILSVGEAFYSPRVYEYAAAIAPKGQEASYSALSYIPFLLAKLMTGVFFGNSLARYCPETGPRHSETLWLFVALTSLVAPIGLLLLRPWIRVREAGRAEDGAAA